MGLSQGRGYAFFLYYAADANLSNLESVVTFRFVNKYLDMSDPANSSCEATTARAIIIIATTSKYWKCILFGFGIF